MPGAVPARARAALGAGILARDGGELATAQGHLEASLAWSRALGETGLVAWALRDLGQLFIQGGEPAAAAPLLAEGLALARAAGDGRGEAAALMMQAESAARGGDTGRAQALGEESLAAARRAGDPWLLSAVLYQLGTAAVDQGDLGAAGPVVEEGRALAGDLGMLSRAAEFEFLLSRVAMARGEPERALRLLESFRAAVAQSDAPDAILGLTRMLVELGRMALAREEPAEGARLFREALRLRRAIGERLGCVAALELLAEAAAGGDPARAAWLLGAAAAGRRTLGAVAPLYPSSVEATERRARAAGPAAFDAARAAGAALSLEQAAAEALQEAPPGAA